MDYERLLIIDYSTNDIINNSDSVRSQRYNSLVQACEMGAMFTCVFEPTEESMPDNVYNRVIVVVFETARQKQLYTLAHGHTFVELDVEDPGLEWFEYEWHQRGIPI